MIKKQWGKRILVFLFSALLALVVAEALVRILWHPPQPRFLIVDADLGHRHRPGVTGYFAREGLGRVSINQHGFRDKDYPLEKGRKARLYADRRLQEVFRQEGLAFLSLLPLALEADKMGIKLHGFEPGKAGHWNREGHQLAARALKDFLTLQEIIR